VKRSTFTHGSFEATSPRISDVASVLPSSTKITSHSRPCSAARRRGRNNGIVSASLSTGTTTERSMAFHLNVLHEPIDLRQKDTANKPYCKKGDAWPKGLTRQSPNGIG